MNCLTGQGQESGLSSAEMDQLIQNVRLSSQGVGTARPQAQRSELTFPHRSWRSLTSTRTAPSTSLNSSTLSPAPRTLSGVLVSRGWLGVHCPDCSLGQSWWWQEGRAALCQICGNGRGVRIPRWLFRAPPAQRFWSLQRWGLVNSLCDYQAGTDPVISLAAPSRLSCELRGCAAALLQFLQLLVASAISFFREHRPGPSMAWLCCNALGRNSPALLSGACLAAGGPRNLLLLQPLCCPSTKICILMHSKGSSAGEGGNAAPAWGHSTPARPSLPPGPIPVLCLPAAGRELPSLPASSAFCISGSLPAATWIHFSEQ